MDDHPNDYDDLDAYQNPTSQQVLKVVETMKKVMYRAGKKGALDVYQPEICGTVNCVAGWYVVAKGTEDPQTLKYIRENRVNYKYGAMLMAEDLGFDDEDELMAWAEVNPEIWGNKWGNLMFSRYEAYTGKLDVRVTCEYSDIITHWAKVAERLKVMEGSTNG